MSRAVFFEEEHAHAVAARLRGDGFEVRVGREAFAGEDDDEDHPWAVSTDAPVTMLELLADQYDGWVDHDDDPAYRPAPLDLPMGPRRTYGPTADG